MVEEQPKTHKKYIFVNIFTGWQLCNIMAGVLLYNFKLTWFLIVLIVAYQGYFKTVFFRYFGFVSDFQNAEIDCNEKPDE